MAAEVTDHVADVVSADDVAGDDVADDADECCAECVAVDDDAAAEHGTTAAVGHRLSSD